MPPRARRNDGCLASPGGGSAARRCGVIGKEHIEACFVAAGVAPASFKYTRVPDVEDGVPYVVETAFGIDPKASRTRRIITGVNWSVALGNPFRSFGRFAESLD